MSRFGSLEDERREFLERLRPHLGDELIERYGHALSSRDVAMLFQVSAATVRRWAESGKVPARRTLGGRWVFPLESIRAALEQLETQGTMGRSEGRA